MKILMVVASSKTSNTLKVATSMETALKESDNELIVQITTPNQIHLYELESFDLVGFGTGIYMGKPDKKLMNLIKLIKVAPQKVFIFVTSGSKLKEQSLKTLIMELKNKKKEIVGQFSCLGFSNFFILKLFGGINKGHPTVAELKKGNAYILKLVQDLKRKQTV